MKTELTPRDRIRCRLLYEELIGPLRETARANGYAIGVHGSLARDIDLIAVPWTAEAVDELELAEALRKTAEGITGAAFISPHEDCDHMRNGMPGFKPHGRRVWSFHLGHGPYIDLSVMPRLINAYVEAVP